MKKSLIILSCAISFCFFGCASKNVEEIIENEVAAPELTENESDEADSDNDVNIDSDSETSEEESSIETVDSEHTEDDEISDVYEDSSFLDLEDIDEPVVITLDPPAEIEETLENNEDSKIEEPISIEEAELPINESESVSESDNIDTENSVQNADEENNNDDSINVENEDDVIDVTDDDGSAIEDNSEKVIEEITPSRKVTLKKNEYLDITYPGNGWVFMGLTDGSKDLIYFGRKLGTGQTKFTLQAKNSGVKIVHFYKEDNLSNETIDDYIEVEILNEKGSNKDHINAPEYKLPLTKKAKDIIETNKQKIEIIEKKEDIKNETTAATTAAPVEKEPIVKQENQSAIESKKELPETIIEDKKVTSPVDSKLLLKEAQLLYNEKEYEEANKKLNQFFEIAVDKRDEGLFLRGQILESKSRIQNIKEAIESYTSLTKNYPASKYWDDANKRIIYLKRFYLEVR